jgi:glycosyltransferase involved in cell wall biosynthesis
MDFIYSPISIEQGFGVHPLFEHPNVRWIELKTEYPLGNTVGMFQNGLIKHIIHTKPDIILISANPRFVSLWILLLMGKIFGIKVYPIGQGLVKKKKPNLLQKTIYRLICNLGTQYVCYTDSVKKSLEGIVDPKSLVVEYNTQYNDFPVVPEEKSGEEQGIFFIGRLRYRCGIDILIKAVEILREREHTEMELYIIGEGTQSSILTTRDQKWIHYYGSVFDDQRISDISRNCRFGCYPGDMGLSVVHMFSMSLPPILHNCFAEHMGPEPSYVTDGINGFFYEPKMDVTSLCSTIRKMWELPQISMKKMQYEAFMTFSRLSEPPFHERILRIIGCEEN